MLAIYVIYVPACDSTMKMSKMLLSVFGGGGLKITVQKHNDVSLFTDLVETGSYLMENHSVVFTLISGT